MTNLVTNPVTGSGIVDQGASIALGAASQLGANAQAAGYLQPNQIGATGGAYIPTLQRQVSQANDQLSRAELEERARQGDNDARLQLAQLNEQARQYDNGFGLSAAQLAELQRSNTNAGALDLAGLGENQRVNTYQAQLGSANLGETQRQFDAQYQRDVAMFGLDVANANYTQRMGQAQTQLAYLNLLTSLRGPSNALQYNFALNAAADPAGTGGPTQTAQVNPFAAFANIAQEYSYDPAQLQGALRPAQAPPQIASAGQLPTLQGPGDVPTLQGAYSAPELDLGFGGFGGASPLSGPSPTFGGLTGATATPASSAAATPPAGGGGAPPSYAAPGTLPNGPTISAITGLPLGQSAVDPATGRTYTNYGVENGGLSGLDPATLQSVAPHVLKAYNLDPTQFAPQTSTSPSTGKEMTTADLATYNAIKSGQSLSAAVKWLADNGFIPKAALGGRFQGTAVMTGDHPTGRRTGVEELVHARNDPRGPMHPPIVDVLPLGDGVDLLPPGMPRAHAGGTFQGTPELGRSPYAPLIGGSPEEIAAAQQAAAREYMRPVTEYGIMEPQIVADPFADRRYAELTAQGVDLRTALSIIRAEKQQRMAELGITTEQYNAALAAGQDPFAAPFGEMGYLGAGAGTQVPPEAQQIELGQPGGEQAYSSFQDISASANPVSYQTYSQTDIGRLPTIQKLIGTSGSSAFGATGFDTVLPGTNVDLGSGINIARYADLAPSERSLAQNLYETPREFGGLGLDFNDVLERSRRAAPVGPGSLGPTFYG